MVNYSKVIKYLYLIQSFTSIAFFHFSSGLIYFDNASSKYKNTDSLFSSGSDDDIAMFLYGLFSFVGFLLLLFKRKSIKYICGVIAVITVFHVLSLLLIQVGSVYLTLYYDSTFLFIFTFFLEVIIMLFLIHPSFCPQNGNRFLF